MTQVRPEVEKYQLLDHTHSVSIPKKFALQLGAIAERAINVDRLVSYTKFQKSSTVFYQPSVLPRRGKKPKTYP